MLKWMFIIVVEHPVQWCNVGIINKLQFSQTADDFLTSRTAGLSCILLHGLKQLSVGLLQWPLLSVPLRFFWHKYEKVKLIFQYKYLHSFKANVLVEFTNHSIAIFFSDLQCLENIYTLLTDVDMEECHVISLICIVKMDTILWHAVVTVILYV